MERKRLRLPRVSRRAWFYAGAWGLALFAILWGVHRGRIYAHETDRLEVKRISVSGVHRVSENEILARAGYTPDTHVLDLDLEETREAIEEILWVRYATVQRVWPSEIVIGVAEREPIALARIDSELFQVDIDGVVLPTDALTQTSAPILNGLRSGDSEGNREKVAIYAEIVDAIGESQLSEVQVSESGEVAVVPNDNPIQVNLGLTHHRDRWEKYVALSERIRQDYPGALSVDLRFRDQIIIRTTEDGPVENIIWGEETRLL